MKKHDSSVSNIESEGFSSPDGYHDLMGDLTNLLNDPGAEPSSLLLHDDKSVWYTKDSELYANPYEEGSSIFNMDHLYSTFEQQISLTKETTATLFIDEGDWVMFQ